MKKILIIFSVFVLFSCVKCGHTDWQQRKNTRVQLKGTVLNQDYVFKVGDTIKIAVVVPDTVRVTNLKDNTTSFSVVNSMEGGDICFMQVREIDTINKKMNHVDSTIQIQSAYGKSPSGCHSFNKTSKPFTCLVHLILKKKGIYWIWLSPPDNNIKINGSIEGVTAISLIMNKKEENWQALAKSLKFVRSEQESLNLFRENETNGGGDYGFRVE
jgi:hypothetical protein